MVCNPLHLSIALHVAKNFMVDTANPGAEGNPMGSTRVPLILAIWGSKGCGKTFNLELACKASIASPNVPFPLIHSHHTGASIHGTPRDIERRLPRLIKRREWTNEWTNGPMSGPMNGPMDQTVV